MNSISLFGLLVTCCLCVVCDSTDGLNNTKTIEEGIIIELITLQNPDNIQILSHTNVSSIDDTYFNASLPTRVFVHGWRSKGEFKQHLINAYFYDGRHDINLIGINWEHAAGTLYGIVRQRVPTIGEFTARYVDSLIQRGALNLDNLSFIGFSLGAHVVGIAGKYMKSGKIRKITGLDPAGVYFSYGKPNERLAIGDALYVETIQTSFLGFSEPLGDVSFFPNIDRAQPGCGIDITGACSHQRAYKYFSTSINKLITGYLCDSKACSEDETAVLGGEPGSFDQTSGVYVASIVMDGSRRLTIPESNKTKRAYENSSN